MAAPDRPRFARALRAFRLHVGVTQSWLSKAVGKDQGMVSDYEMGSSIPDIATVVAMENVLELKPGTLSQFLGWVPVNADKLPDPPDITTHRGVIPGSDMAAIADFVLQVAGPDVAQLPGTDLVERIEVLERVVEILGGGGA